MCGVHLLEHVVGFQEGSQQQTGCPVKLINRDLKEGKYKIFIFFETHIFLVIIERWYLGKRNTPDGCLLSWCPVEADLCQRARGILSN